MQVNVNSISKIFAPNFKVKPLIRAERGQLTGLGSAKDGERPDNH